MSSNVTNNLFNKDAPIDSIRQFSENHSLLSEKQKKYFLSSMTSYFSEQAYYDRQITLPKNIVNTFSDKDLSKLFTIMSNLRMQINPLSANMSKVISNMKNIHTKDGINPVFQIYSPSRTQGESELWGWINREYFDLSKPLSHCQTDSSNELICKDIKPTALFALQRLQHAIDHYTKVDITVEPLLDLFVFAIDWKI